MLKHLLDVKQASLIASQIRAAISRSGYDAVDTAEAKAITQALIDMDGIAHGEADAPVPGTKQAATAIERAQHALVALERVL